MVSMRMRFASSLKIPLFMILRRDVQRRVRHGCEQRGSTSEAGGRGGGADDALLQALLVERARLSRDLLRFSSNPRTDELRLLICAGALRGTAAICAALHRGQLHGLSGVGVLLRGAGGGRVEAVCQHGTPETHMHRPCAAQGGVCAPPEHRQRVR